MVSVRRAVPLVLMIVAVALLGACGEDDPPAGRDAVASEAAAGDEGAGNGDPAKGDPEVCSIVPAAAVERVIGGSPKPQDASVSGEPRCQYAGADGAHLLVAYGSADGYDRWVTTFRAKPISGVGDKAAEFGDYSIFAVKGERSLQFSVGGAVGGSGIAPVDKDAARQAMRESLESL
jgi:hypothetical protein